MSDSLDPRVNRIDAPESVPPQQPMDQWQTYEVFLQQHRGEQHTHAGIVHAPNADMAILFAKEQYARRFNCVNLWVVKTADITATSYDDADMFAPAFDKNYRESHGYKEVRYLVDAWKQRTGQAPSPSTQETDEHAPKPKVVMGKPGIVIGKKK